MILLITHQPEDHDAVRQVSTRDPSDPAGRRRNINDIAQCFYRHLFTTHPELLDGTFNRGNQAEGTQQASI